MDERHKLDPIHKYENNPSVYLLWVLGVPILIFGIYIFLTGIFNIFSGDGNQIFGQEGFVAIIVSFVFILIGTALMPSPHKAVKFLSTIGMVMRWVTLKNNS